MMDESFLDSPELQHRANLLERVNAALLNTPASQQYGTLLDFQETSALRDGVGTVEGAYDAPTEGTHAALCFRWFKALAHLPHWRIVSVILAWYSLPHLERLVEELESGTLKANDTR